MKYLLVFAVTAFALSGCGSQTIKHNDLQNYAMVVVQKPYTIVEIDGSSKDFLLGTHYSRLVKPGSHRITVAIWRASGNVSEASSICKVKEGHAYLLNSVAGTVSGCPEISKDQARQILGLQ